MNCVALQQGPSCERPPAARYACCGCTLDELQRHSIIGGKLKMRTLRAKDTSHLRIAQTGGRRDQCIEHGLEIECRAADDLEHVGGGSLLLQGFTEFVEQTRVLDGDDRLRGEVLDQLDLLVGERADLLAEDADRADQRIFLD